MISYGCLNSTFSNSPPTFIGPDHQWTILTNTSYIQWLSLAKQTLKLAHASMNPSLVACTCKCGWALNPSTEIDSNFRNVMVGFNRYVNLMAGPWCPIMHRFSHKARVNVKHGGLKSIKAALSFCRCLVHNQSWFLHFQSLPTTFSRFALDYIHSSSVFFDAIANDAGANTCPPLYTGDTPLPLKNQWMHCLAPVYGLGWTNPYTTGSLEARL